MGMSPDKGGSTNPAGFSRLIINPAPQNIQSPIGSPPILNS